jgi:hypothetical protein
MTGQTGKNSHTNLKMTHVLTNLGSGLFWNAFMIDPVNMYFIASWDTAQMNDGEVDGHCDSLADVLRKLADENNWDKKVGDVFTR